MFIGPDALQAAKLKVSCLNKSYDGGKPVWVDVKKTYAELKPSRVVNKVFQALNDLELNGQKRDVKKHYKTVLVGGKQVGYTLRGQWVWTKNGMGLYDENILTQIKGVADED